MVLNQPVWIEEQHCGENHPRLKKKEQLIIKPTDIRWIRLPKIGALHFKQ